MKGLLMLGVAGVLVGCAAKPGLPPEPGVGMAASSGTDLAILEKGHQVYLANCMRCHEPMMPKEVSQADWHLVVPGMSWNAGISEADEEALTAYILAARSE